ncbi:MAG: PEGA domain-containing protein [Magnetococcales bacterium]|nr:PEGA domain-containing protein [Magnetococcales bacterium]
MPIPMLMALFFLFSPSPAMADDNKGVETTLLVKVIPRGAEVLVNGVPMGIAPFLIKKPPLGQVSLRARHMGYRSLTRNFEIVANQNNVATLIMASRAGNLGTLTGTLIIETQPQGATLALDANPLGKSPMRAENLAEGDHQLTVQFPGLGEKTIPVQVIGGETIQTNILWDEPKPKKFRLDLTPQNAKVVFLNHPQPYRSGMPLPKGRYLLRASHPGYVTTDIAVDMGEKDFHSWVSLQPTPPTQNPEPSDQTTPAPTQ